MSDDKPELHPSLRSVPPEEFDKLVGLTDEEIDEALALGKAEADAWRPFLFRRPK